MKMEADLLRTISELRLKSGLDPGGQTIDDMLFKGHHGKYFIMELEKQPDSLRKRQEDPPQSPCLVLTPTELSPCLEEDDLNRVMEQAPLCEGPIEYLCRLDEKEGSLDQTYSLVNGSTRPAALDHLMDRDEQEESNYNFNLLNALEAETFTSLSKGDELLVDLSLTSLSSVGGKNLKEVNTFLMDVESLQEGSDLCPQQPIESLLSVQPSEFDHPLSIDEKHVNCMQTTALFVEEECHPFISSEKVSCPHYNTIPSYTVHCHIQQERSVESLVDLCQYDSRQDERSACGDEVVRLRAVFDALDQDGDGFVSMEEFIQFATAYGAEQVKDLTRYLDPAGLGVIGFEDFYHGISEIRNGDQDIQLYDMGYSADEEPPEGPDEFEDFNTFEANEVTDSAYVGSESTYSECETFTDEDTGALAHHEMGDEVEQESTIEVHLNGSLLLNTVRPSLDELSLNADLNIGYNVLEVNGEEEHFEDYGEGNERDIFSSSLCNGELRFGTNLDCSLRLSPSPDRVSSKKVARHLHQTSTVNNMEEPLNHHMNCEDTDMNDKVFFLEKRVTELEKDASTNEEQHRRLKQENLQLVHRANALEEQLKEQELKAEEAISEEIRRHKEILSKTEREKDMDYEQLACRMKAIETENHELRSTIPCIIAHAERLEEIKRRMEDKVEDNACELKEAYSSKKKLEDKLNCERHKHQKESECTQKLIEELRKQLEQLQLYKLETEQKRGRANSAGLQEYNSRARESELEQEIRRLKQDNRNLKEQNDELNGQIINLSIQGAKHLFSTSFSDSLAAEISSVSRDELLEAIQKQEEINLRLQDYIDRIIVAIMETNPSILEVKLE